MRALLVLGVAVAAALTCDKIGHCQQCASTKGNLLGNCRWCPLDNQCHTPGSIEYNVCSSSQNIADASKCPTEPGPRTKFDKEEAADMTRYSRAAYADNAETEGCAAISKTFLSNTFTCLKSATYQINYANRNFTVLSFYGYDSLKNRIVLSYRGSVNSQALWEALVTVLEKAIPFPPAPAAMINPFFLVGATGLINAMGADFAWLKSLLTKYPSAEVFVTGHSLGGAMASLTATQLVLQKITPSPPVLYTFGQPRTGDGTYAALATKSLPRAYRVVNANDPVPHVPFCTGTCSGCSYGSKCTDEYSCCSLNGNYVHHSSEMWFPEGEYQNNVMCGYRECLGAPLGEDASCSNRYVLSNLFDLAAHSAYWNALSGYCNVAPLGAQPNNTIESPKNLIPITTLVGVGAIILLVFLTAGLVWLRSRARKASQIDSFHLLESFSVAS